MSAPNNLVKRRKTDDNRFDLVGNIISKQVKIVPQDGQKQFADKINAFPKILSTVKNSENVKTKGLSEITRLLAGGENLTLTNLSQLTTFEITNDAEEKMVKEIVTFLCDRLYSHQLLQIADDEKDILERCSLIE